MSLTVTQLSSMIEDLKPLYSAAKAADDTAKMDAIRADYLLLKELRRLRSLADLEVGREAEFIAALALQTETIKRIAERLSADDVLLTLELESGDVGTIRVEDRATRAEEAFEEMVREADLDRDPPVEILGTRDPAPDGEPGDFVAARKSATRTVMMVDAEGREVLRVGGSRSWRNNNPGNIRKSQFAREHGAIGDDGAFAIFPDDDKGFAAIVSLLRAPSYDRLTLEGAINRYAPPSENDTHNYVGFVAQKSGIHKDAAMTALKIADVRKIARAIRQMEGWTPGEVRDAGPASGPLSSPAGITSATGASREWMEIAEREAALSRVERSEWTGPGRHNPRILNYFSSTWMVATADEVAWCAAFVNYCLEESGHVGTGHPGARSFFWNKKRQFIRLTGPSVGAIGVLRYPPYTDANWDTGSGHVGFVKSFTATHVTLLGGNQSNTINETTWKIEKTVNGKTVHRFEAFMMPVIN